MVQTNANGSPRLEDQGVNADSKSVVKVTPFYVQLRSRLLECVGKAVCEGVLSGIATCLMLTYFSQAKTQHFWNTVCGVGTGLIIKPLGL